MSDEPQYIPGEGIRWGDRILTIAQVARDFDIKRDTLSKRLIAGMAVKDALSKPSRLNYDTKLSRRGPVAMLMCQRHAYSTRFNSRTQCPFCQNEANNPEVNNMSATCTITVKREDGSFVAAHCRLGGFPKRVGPILLDHYNSQARAEQLVEGGNMEYIGPSCEPANGATFGHTVYLGRDFGEGGSQPKRGPTAKSVEFDGENGLIDYRYLWADGRWYVEGRVLADSMGTV